MKRHAFILALIALASSGYDSCEFDGPLGPERPIAAVPIEVLSWNVYVGAHIDELMTVQNPEEIPLVAARLWGDVQSTSFPERAYAIAHEIASRQPHLIGLQEVSLFRMQSPGDTPIGNPEAAEDTVLDFLGVLMAELEERGIFYRVAAVSENFDVELPIVTETGLADIRLTDYDVILTRYDVLPTDAGARRFETNLELPVGGQRVRLYRGWAYADVSFRDGRSARFVTTHLEPELAAPIQAAQAAELLYEIERSPLPVLLTGDLNSAADGSSTPTYASFIEAGFIDLAPDRPTCCRAPSLQGSEPLTKRIDYVLLAPRGNAEWSRAEPLYRGTLPGSTEGDRTASGLWPSDHAGVFASFNAAAAAAVDR